ncbi:MAG: hypothetical protein R2752_10165 [Vicinamibacterales bacterium]
MITVVRHFLAAIPFDPRSRRAIDETLLDWEAEAADATRGPASGRAALDVRWSVALVRVVLLATAREAAGVPLSWLAVRLTVGLLFLAVLLAVPWAWRAGWLLPVDVWLPSALLLLPANLVAIAPPGVFAALAIRPGRRPVPVVGTACVVLVVLSAAVTVVPAANEAFRQTIYAATTAGRSGTPALPTWTPPVLVTVGHLGLAVQAALTVILAARMWPVSRGMRFVAVAAAFPIFVESMSLAQGPFRAWGVTSAGAVAGASWTLALTLMALTLWLHGRAPDQLA